VDSADEQAAAPPSATIEYASAALESTAAGHQSSRRAASRPITPTVARTIDKVLP